MACRDSFTLMSLFINVLSYVRFHYCSLHVGEVLNDNPLQREVCVQELNLLREINFGPSRSVTLTNYSDYQFEKCQCLK
jgi:hypothetical protein